MAGDLKLQNKKKGPIGSHGRNFFRPFFFKFQNGLNFLRILQQS